MGRIQPPELQAMAEHWSPVVTELMTALGEQTWPPKKVRRSLFSKPELITRYSLEGPVPFGKGIAWALSHTKRPSSFDAHGNLSTGERHFWLLTLEPGSPPSFTLEGVSRQTGIPAESEPLRQAFCAAHTAGPKIDEYYGNKGPLSHR